jgi:putative nucleotidyltransferase with HDIG domain
VESALRRALADAGEAPGVLPLPATAAELLEALDAPPRLAAHLRAVYDVAVRLADGLAREGLAFDRDAVLFGAATHDIGKTRHVEELEQPGHAHEEAGYDLLLSYGVPAELARFAGTHGSGWLRPGATTEDLLVSVADKVWKGQRVTDLEQRLLERLTAATGLEEWDAFLRLDSVLAALAADADRLLAFQFRYPVHPGDRPDR